VKRAFDIDEALGRIDEAIRPFPPAAMFQLFDEGLRTVFEQLVSCILSIRTRDETSLLAARRLFGRARTPADIVRLGPEGIDSLIADCTFHETKARQIYAIAENAVREHKGKLPCDPDVLLGFSGVGPKCANLTLGIACRQPRISVDIHVHRVTNRWGYATASTPEGTLAVLEQKLPEAHRVDINRLLVPFGKHICTGQLPRCSTCPVLDMCQQVGVTKHR
jgi:endonuclease-3